MHVGRGRLRRGEMVENIGARASVLEMSNVHVPVREPQLGQATEEDS